MKEYWSKLWLCWKDMKVTDCEESLLKYGYIVRVKR
jgi:hypothetical protein